MVPPLHIFMAEEALLSAQSSTHRSQLPLKSSAYSTEAHDNDSQKESQQSGTRSLSEAVTHGRHSQSAQSSIVGMFSDAPAYNFRVA